MLESLVADLGAWWDQARVRTITWLFVTWIGALAAISLTNRFFDRVDRQLTRFGIPERRLSRLDFVVDAFIVAMAGFLTLAILGLGKALWGAVALTSVTGVVLALAAQRVGQNLLAGLVILFERPFVVGDTVEVSGDRGQVRQVSLYSTTLVTPEGLRQSVPNHRVLDETITNFSARDERRISVDVDLIEAEDLDRVREVLREAVESEAHRIEERPIRVFAKESLSEGVRFEVRYWVQREHYADHCLPSALERLLDAVNEADLPTAQPAQKVYVHEEPA